MKKLLLQRENCLILIAIFLLSIYLNTQIINAQVITFRKVFDIPNSGGNSVEQTTTDGGYIIAGSTLAGYDNTNVYLIKTNAIGDTLWTKQFERQPNKSDWAQQVLQTFDGGYIVVGTAGSYDEQQVYLIKTDSIGDSLWTKNYGIDDASHPERGYGVRQTSDSGYVIIGYNDAPLINPNIYLIKTNSDGDTLWTKSFDAAGGIDYGRAIQITSDGGFIIAAESNTWHGSSGGQYPVLIKINSDGDTSWTKVYQVPPDGFVGSVFQNMDGGYILAGRTKPTYFDADIFVIRTDSTGDTLWTKILKITNNNDAAYDILQTNDGGFFICGSTYSNGWEDTYLLKLDATGEIQWTQIINMTGNDRGNSAQQTIDGGYVITGNAGSKCYLLKTDSLGTSVGISGQSFEKTMVKIFPNPFSSSTTLIIPSELKNSGLVIYDVLGNEVRKTNITHSEGSVVIERGILSKGIYLLQLKNENKIIATQKIVIQ